MNRHHNANELKRTELEQSESAEKKNRDDIAQDCYSKFEIFKMQHKKDSAAYYIELRADLDAENWRWQYDAGYFFINNRNYPFIKNPNYSFIKNPNYSKAKQYLLQALSHFSTSNMEGVLYQFYYKRILQLLTESFFNTEDYQNAYTFNSKYLPIAKTTYENNPATGAAAEYSTTLQIQSICAIRLKRYHESEKYAREAMAVNPEDTWLNIILAPSLLFQGNYEKAQKLYIQ